MTRTLTYQIHSDAQTVKQFLSAQGFSRQTIIALKKQSESILVNEIRVPASFFAGSVSRNSSKMPGIF